MWKEFKAFIKRGNVVDLAVGVIIGGAFTDIVNSLVKNLINPLLGLFIGRIDLSNLVLKVGEANFKYGEFLNTVINFLIISFIVFLLVKGVNKLTAATQQGDKDKKSSAPSTDDYLREIRDLLKEKH